MSEATRADISRLVDLRDEPLSIDEVQQAVTDPRAGGIAMFVGTVRNRDQGQGVDALAYSAHPTVLEQMRNVVGRVEARFTVAGQTGQAGARELLGLAVVHRVGDLRVGDLAVVAAASSVHRSEAFDACRALIDDLKTTVPIWKHQAFDDGTDQWVGTP
ncbi:MAG: molybdenum cofactor biosynthesis protein MoaE [Nocardioidaceae bacterium]